jgi:hypothetical protein
MTSNEQRFTGTGIGFVTVECHHANAAIRWYAGEEIVLRGGRADIVSRQGQMIIKGSHPHGFGGRPDLEVDLPASLPSLAVHLNHGNLSLEEVHGTVEARIDHGEARVLGGHGSVTMRIGSGDVGIDNLTGPLTLLNGSGDIRLDHVVGAIVVKNGSGDIEVLGGAGDLTIKAGSGAAAIVRRTGGAIVVETGSGSISITGGEAHQTSLQTGSGELRCSAELGVGRHSFSTGSGNLTVALPRHLAARVEVNTAHGKIRSDLPLVSVGQRGPKSLTGQRLVGSIGEGAPRAELSLRTQRGDVRLSWLDQPAPPTPPSPPAPPMQPVPPVPSDIPIPLGPASAPTARADDTADPGEAEQRSILAALATGTLSVAEAEDLLAALDARSRDDR